MPKGNNLGFKQEEEDKPKKPLMRPSPSGRLGSLTPAQLKVIEELIEAKLKGFSGKIKDEVS